MWIGITKNSNWPSKLCLYLVWSNKLLSQSQQQNFQPKFSFLYIKTFNCLNNNIINTINTIMLTYHIPSNLTQYKKDEARKSRFWVLFMMLVLYKGKQTKKKWLISDFKAMLPGLAYGCKSSVGFLILKYLGFADIYLKLDKSVWIRHVMYP